jgi:ribosomal protein L11 methyltransferase
MAFLALVFDAAAEDADAWADALLDAGASSVDVTDPAAGTAAEVPLYGEPGEPTDGLWPVNRLTALFGPDANPDAALATAARALDRPAPSHETHPVPEQDWVRATQAQFAPIPITDRLWIVPSWCTAPDPAAINLILDPGLAFGTGSHPTTRLCLRWLAMELTGGERVLDYGCGSGILAIAAAKLGAAEVIGTDIDPQAIVASRDNARRNDVSATFALPDALAQTTARGVDVIVANILANPLVLLAPALAGRVRAGGRIVLSGILAPQADSVVAAYGRWFNIAVWDGEGDWVALAGTRNAVDR